MTPVIKTLPVLVVNPYSRCNLPLWHVRYLAENRRAGVAVRSSGADKRWLRRHDGPPGAMGGFLRRGTADAPRNIPAVRRREKNRGPNRDDPRYRSPARPMTLRKSLSRRVDRRNRFRSMVPNRSHDRAIAARSRRVFGAGIRRTGRLHELKPGFPVGGRCTLPCSDRIANRAARDCVAGGTRTGPLLDIVSRCRCPQLRVQSAGGSKSVAPVGDAVAGGGANSGILESQIEAIVAEGHCGQICCGVSRESCGGSPTTSAATQVLRGTSPRCATRRGNRRWWRPMARFVRASFIRSSEHWKPGEDLKAVLNGPAAVKFRSTLDIAANPICRRCVCSLNWER